jgi:hypothetical protein
MPDISGQIAPGGSVRPVGVDGVDLYWLPLGAGDRLPVVRSSGRLFEGLAARRAPRSPCDLYHAALEISLDGVRYAIEMTPAWGGGGQDRDTVVSGPVGLRPLGRSRFFRYEVHRWRDGLIPDLALAVGGACRLSEDSELTRRLWEAVPAVPAATWGRDEQHTGDMWNSNSVVAWILVTTGVDLTDVVPPAGGRAPGWSAGAVVGRRS